MTGRVCVERRSRNGRVGVPSSKIEPSSLKSCTVSNTNNSAVAQILTLSSQHSAVAMPQFRAKRLDLGGFVNAKIIRDHTKRKVFEKFEEQR